MEKNKTDGFAYDGGVKQDQGTITPADYPTNVRADDLNKIATFINNLEDADLNIIKSYDKVSKDVVRIDNKTQFLRTTTVPNVKETPVSIFNNTILFSALQGGVFGSDKMVTSDNMIDEREVAIAIGATAEEGLVITNSTSGAEKGAIWYQDPKNIEFGTALDPELKAVWPMVMVLTYLNDKGFLTKDNLSNRTFLSYESVGEAVVFDAVQESDGQTSKFGNFEDLPGLEKTNLVASIVEINDDLNSSIADVDVKIGEVDDLKTTVKIDTVSAINEVFDNTIKEDQVAGTTFAYDKATNLGSVVDVVSTASAGAPSVIGKITDLKTTDKTNVVAAINELVKTGRSVDAFIKADTPTQSATDKARGDYSLKPQASADVKITYTYNNKPRVVYGAIHNYQTGEDILVAEEWNTKTGGYDHVKIRYTSTDKESYFWCRLNDTPLPIVKIEIYVQFKGV